MLYEDGDRNWNDTLLSPSENLMVKKRMKLAAG